MEEDGDKLFHTHGLSFDSTLDSLMEADFLIDDKDASFIPPTEAEMSTQINYRVDLSSSEGGMIINNLGATDAPMDDQAETTGEEQTGVENIENNEGSSLFNIETADTEGDMLSENQSEILQADSSEENKDINSEHADMLTEKQKNAGHDGIEDSKGTQTYTASEKEDELQTNSESEELWNIAVHDAEDGEEAVAEIELDDVVAITEVQPDVKEDNIEQTGDILNTAIVEAKQVGLSDDISKDNKTEQRENQKEIKDSKSLSTMKNESDTITTDTSTSKTKTVSSSKDIKSLNLNELKAKRQRKLAEKSSAKQTRTSTDKKEGKSKCPANPTFLKHSGKRKLEKGDYRKQELPSKLMRVDLPEHETKSPVITNGDTSNIEDDIIHIDKNKSDTMQVTNPSNTNITTDESSLSDKTASSRELPTESMSSDNTQNSESLNNTLTEGNGMNDDDNNDETEIDITDIHNGDIHNAHGIGIAAENNIDTTEDADNNVQGIDVDSVDNTMDTPEDTDNNVAYSGDESSDNDFDENEIEAWLDEGLNKKDGEEKTGPDGEKRNPQDDLKPGEFLARDKIVLEEKDVSPFEVLPPGWIQVSHQSGMYVYLHKESRVCTLAKPYNLGPLSVRKHSIPVSAVPCLQYRKALEKEKQAELREAEAGKEAESENKDTPTSQEQPITNGVVTEKGDNVPQMPTVSMQSVDKAYLETQELTDYCKNLFHFKTVVIKKFRTWREKRVHLIEEKKKRPGLPSNTKLITCPLPEDPNDKSKRRKKDFVLNPVNKSPVCILHEYTQHTLKVQPKYVYKEIENWEKPFEASVLISDIKYGSGTGSGKRQAKAEAAKATLLVLMPEIADQFTDQKNTTKNKEDERADLSYFEDVPIEDPRVVDLCDKASLPKPYQILIDCLRRNFGLGDTKLEVDRKIISNQRTEFSLTVGKHTAKVVCRNKREGKQRASQTMLQILHPHLKSWATILRLYNNSSQMNYDEQERKKFVADMYMSKEKNFKILKNLKEAMRKAKKDKGDQEREGTPNLQTIYRPLDL